MKINRIHLIAILMWAFCLSINAQNKVKISILGDSYSTFSGFVSPQKNPCFYRMKSKFPNDVHKVEDTWWHMLCKNAPYELLVNNSYSGSTICNTGYAKNDYSDRSFIKRMKDIGNPDVLFIFGGTNDCWAGVPLGEYNYGKKSKKDLYKFRPAFCYMLEYLLQEHPQMTIINICNSELDKDYVQSMQLICQHYNVYNVQLEGVDKQYKHPSVKGMRQIYDQIDAKIKEIKKLTKDKKKK